MVDQHVSFEAGHVIGPYELHERLGAGGMGQVYRATHLRLRQMRALKLLLPQFAGESRFIERFEREARLAAQLDHPHIVKVLDVGEDSGYHYIAMELLLGVTVRQILRAERQLDLPRVIKLIEQLASALDYAHTRRIAHRDVKPGNIFVNSDGHVTLVDFGIARAAGEIRLTRAGQLVGTAEYMAPEVVMGAEHGPSADLYALGIVAFELLTGTRPFTARRIPDVMTAQVNKPPPSLLTHRPDLPADVDRVVLRQLSKNPAQRFPTASEMARALASAGAMRPGTPDRFDETQLPSFLREAGPGSPGPGSPGPASAGPGSPGPASAGPGSPGPASAGPGSPGPASAGPAMRPAPRQPMPSAIAPAPFPTHTGPSVPVPAVPGPGLRAASGQPAAGRPAGAPKPGDQHGPSGGIVLIGVLLLLVIVGSGVGFLLFRLVVAR
jgi:serine/threonine-protein kinase